MTNRELIDEAKRYNADEIIEEPYLTEDIVLRLIAALEAQEWRPIETAPTNGTTLQVWWPYWSDEPCNAWFENDDWRSSVKMSDRDEHLGPEKWRPLFPPPQD